MNTRRRPGYRRRRIISIVTLPLKVIGVVVGVLAAYFIAACLYILPWVILVLVLHWLGAF